MMFSISDEPGEVRGGRRHHRRGQRQGPPKCRSAPCSVRSANHHDDGDQRKTEVKDPEGGDVRLRARACSPGSRAPARIGPGARPRFTFWASPHSVDVEGHTDDVSAPLNIRSCRRSAPPTSALPRQPWRQGRPPAGDRMPPPRPRDAAGQSPRTRPLTAASSSSSAKAFGAGARAVATSVRQQRTARHALRL